MGRIRTTWIKTITQRIIEAHPDRVTTNFDSNKELLNELDLVKEKGTRNKLAGSIVREMKKKRE